MLEGLKFVLRLKLWSGLLIEEMKGCLRGQAVSLTLIALICPLFIWAWVRNPLLTTFPAPTEQFEDLQLNMLSPVVFTGSPMSLSIYTDRPSEVEDKSNVSQSLFSNDNAEQVPSDPPIDSLRLSSFRNTKKDSDMIQMPTENKECNYAKGKWVPDSRRPLYTGFSCNQWLSEMWACRWMKRPDFSYENFRWQPNQCTMLEFDRFKFLRRMQDKTIALVGDSLGRQQFQSLMCMVTGGKENHKVQDVGKEYGLVKARGALRPDGWAYRFPNTNTTILYYWSASLCELEPLDRSDTATSYAMHLDRPATFLTKYLPRFDVLVLNTGHHWNRLKFKANRWEMYVGGAPCTDRSLANLANAKNLTVYSVAKWLDSQLPRHPRLKVFFRTMSPRHFVNGDWNTGGSCDNLTPLARESEVLQDGSSDTVVEGAVKGTNVNILDITALSQLRDEGHISKYTKKSAVGVHDCLHWCLPGIPDTWNEILAAQL